MGGCVSIPKNVGHLALFWWLIFSLFPLPAKAEYLLSIQGSTTVLPIVQLLAEEYSTSHPEVNISVSGGGSGIGITSLIDGAIDIAMSSRPVAQTEVEKAQAKGLDINPLVIAYDAIAVIVHPSNSLSEISTKNLQKIYTGEITHWQELGWEVSIPLVAISRDFASGTFEVFNQIVLQGKDLRPDALMLVSNLAILNEVSFSPTAIGYVGLAYLNDRVKALAIDGVSPTKEAVIEGSYPLARPLFLVIPEDLPEVAQEFIGFILSEEGQAAIESEGFIGVY